MTSIVRAAGQAQVVNTTITPDYSSDDATKNWFFVVPPNSPTARLVDGRSVYAGVPTSKLKSEVIKAAQRSINARVSAANSPVGMTIVRDDGVLDVDTLSGASVLLSSRFGGAASGVVGQIVQALAAAAAASRLEGATGAKAWTGLIAVPLLTADAVGSSISAVDADRWLSGGGIALGTTAQLPSVRFPSVEQTSAIQRSMPRASNFVRNNKVPLSIGGALVVAGIALYVYRSSEKI